MKLSQIQTDKMQKQLQEYFEGLKELSVSKSGKEQVISVSFPQRTIAEKTSLRVECKCSNQIKDGLNILALYPHSMKEIKSVTGLNMKSCVALVFGEMNTQLVYMFE
tara:strand:+ start:34 stop:354 length:321 start_codon:yes stop_codon:yes gene_type:complete